MAARGHAVSADLVEYLNALVARGYAQTYPGQPVRIRDAGAFVARGFPRLVRREWKAVLASYLLFFLGLGFGYVAIAVDPDAALALVPAEHQHLDPVERVHLEESPEAGLNGGEQAQFAGLLFTHNIEVAFLVFALGLSVGVGTVVMLWYNGLMLGALAMAYQAKGEALWFWAWILPHGVVEISAISARRSRRSSHRRAPCCRPARAPPPTRCAKRGAWR